MTAWKRAAAAALGVLLMVGLSGCPGGEYRWACHRRRWAGGATSTREIPPAVRDIAKEVGNAGRDAAVDVAREEAEPDPQPQRRNQR